MKKFISFLMKQPDNPNIPRPIFIVIFVLVLVGFLFIQFGGGGDEVAVSPPAPSNETSFLDKLKSYVSFFNVSKEDYSEDRFVPPPLKTIPPDLLTVDENILAKADALKDERFEMNKVNLDNIGKKDPMKPLSSNDHPNVGEYLGTFDPERVDDSPSDLKNDSKNYFDGLTVDNIVLNSVEPDPDTGILTATFLAMGGIFTVQEGDYLADIYYVKSVDYKNQKVVLEYKDSVHEITAQRIIPPEKLKK